MPADCMSIASGAPDSPSSDLSVPDGLTLWWDDQLELEVAPRSL
eukprot:CAMPEP_0175218620 /NCGR_PEP_ID=MMETSP0093-20121207/18853_1 /TAXON_ID=311494 /ORGANISM="Alexandrium monilatum, Strain CCMP3105" /LENGTH=43 /DNA_ID= /DNA_START= /DNA_END= /DNA_ORIENTATION=